MTIYVVYYQVYDDVWIMDAFRSKEAAETAIEYYRHVGVLFRNTGYYGQLRITDVEAVLRQEKISDILKDANSKIKG